MAGAALSGITIQGAPVHEGDRLVYPNGGLVRVKGVDRKLIAGMELTMLVLEREEDRATVLVPQGKVASINLRQVASREAIELLFDFLTMSSENPELDWKIRHRDNAVLMSAGGLLDTAKVLKGLHALTLIRPLPTKERELYDNARHQLIGEISAAYQVPPAVGELALDYAFLPPPGSGRVAPKDKPVDIKVLRRQLGGSRRATASTGDDLAVDADDLLDDTEEATEGDAEGAEKKVDPDAEGDGEGGDAPAAEPSDEPAPVVKGAKKPVEKKPAAKKPAEKKPIEKPVEKPVAAKKPVEKPVEAKAAAKKPAEAKPVAAKKPAEKKPAVAKAPEKKPAEKKPAAKKPAEKKPAKKGGSK